MAEPNIDVKLVKGHLYVYHAIINIPYFINNKYKLVCISYK